MKATIHTFAILKEKMPAKFDVDVGANTKVSGVIESIIAQHPDCLELMTSCRVAINEEFVNRDFKITEGTNLYLLPPSSGG